MNRTNVLLSIAVALLVTVGLWSYLGDSNEGCPSCSCDAGCCDSGACAVVDCKCSCKDES